MGYLTPKQERFCKEYVIDLNGSQAAIRAGYSKKSANVEASRLLTNDNIVEFIAQLQAKISERLEISADKVVQELAKIGFNNIQDYVSQGNEISDLTTITKIQAASVESIKTTTKVFGRGEDKYTETTTAIKLHDKVSALEKLGRHLGIFEKDNVQAKEGIKTIIIDRASNAKGK